MSASLNEGVLDRLDELIPGCRLVAALREERAENKRLRELVRYHESIPIVHRPYEQD